MSAIATQDQYQGCLLALALGDARCAAYEGGLLERALWRLIGRTRTGQWRHTDDTQMVLDTARSLLACHAVDQDHLAQCLAQGYAWSRGYGPATASLLRAVRRGGDWRRLNRVRFADGSYGNGAAMRVAVPALYYASRRDRMARAVQQCSEITHAHPLAIEGAQRIALAIRAALGATHSGTDIVRACISDCQNDHPYCRRLDTALGWLLAESDVSPQQVRKVLGHGMAAIESCPTAIYLAARFLNQPFDALLAFICQVGGDTDTIAAMSGAIWGAHNGTRGLPSLWLEKLEHSDELRQAADALYVQAQSAV